MASLKLDVRVQARSQLYAVGIGVAVATGLLGRFLIGEAHAGRALPTLYLLILAGTTYVFGASQIVSEKSQGTLAALRTTPLTTGVYLTSKLITLTAFATLEGAIVQVVAFGAVDGSLLPLVVGILSLGVMYTLAGLGHAASHEAITSFLFPGAMVVMLVSQLPALYILEVGPPALWLAIPSLAPVLLILGAFEPLTTLQWAYALTVTPVSIGLLAWWTRRRFVEHLALGGDR